MGHALCRLPGVAMPVEGVLLRAYRHAEETRSGPQSKNYGEIFHSAALYVQLSPFMPSYLPRRQREGANGTKTLQEVQLWFMAPQNSEINDLIV